jgi:hypothetical protein
MEQPNDERLWRIAKKRASFKKSLFSYLVINAFLMGHLVVHGWPA